MKLSIVTLVGFLATVGPGATVAQEAKPACAAQDTALPAEYAGWASKADLVSADKAADLPKATLAVGKAVTATLHPTREVAYATQPEKPGGSVAKGGMFGLKIDKAGTYTVALGSGPWIDVLQGGKPLESTAHGHGPDCSSIRKMVAFNLQPGSYVVQISANADPTLAIMVARQP